MIDHGEHRHGHALLLGRECLAEDRLLGRLERAGAEALERAVEDERRQRARDAAERRPDHEEDEARTCRRASARRSEPRKPVSGITSTVAMMYEVDDPGDLLDGGADRAADLRAARR